MRNESLYNSIKIHFSFSMGSSYSTFTKTFDIRDFSDKFPPDTTFTYKTNEVEDRFTLEPCRQCREDTYHTTVIDYIGTAKYATGQMICNYKRIKCFRCKIYSIKQERERGDVFKFSVTKLLLPN
jgi:hypothetical protein